MRSPWVRRDVYDVVVAKYEQLLDGERKVGLYLRTKHSERETASEARYVELLDKYHALREQGHAIPAPKPPPQPIEDEFPAPVETAIIVAAEGNRTLERHLRSRARLRMARGEDASDVARRITDGDGSDE